MRDLLGSIHRTPALAHLGALRWAREQLADLDERPIIGALAIGPVDCRVLGQRVEHERWCERVEHWIRLVRRGPPASMSLLVLYSEEQGVCVVVGHPDRLSTWTAPRDGQQIGPWTERRGDLLDIVAEPEQRVLEQRVAELEQRVAAARGRMR